jgi:DNA polymerase III delta prime subunit
MSLFQKARREKIWLKCLFGGPSGSGKTYTALRVATGIARKMGKLIAAIDTENGRIRYYANEFEFSDVQLEVPFTPEKYIEIIDAAVDDGFGILLIDSITHEWDYCLEVHNKMPGNSYTNWAKITPRHDAFMEKILQSPIHILATVRGKDEYTLENKDGKQTPKKIGLGYKQRDNVEYNYTVTFNIDQQNHVADATKDNTHLFEGRYEMLTEKDGEKLFDWANSGEDATPTKKADKPAKKNEETDAKEDPLAKAKTMIGDLAKSLTDSGVERETVSDLIKKYNIINGKGTANYNKLTDVDIARTIYKELKKLTPEKPAEENNEQPE